MEGQSLPVSKIAEDQEFVLTWLPDASGQPRTMKLDAGSKVLFDEENQIFHFRNENMVRTITNSIEVGISAKLKEWEVELVTDPNDGLEPPSVLISDDKVFLSDNGYNFSTEDFFRNACKVIGNRVFNPYEMMPPNGEYGAYFCNFETGDIKYLEAGNVTAVPPLGPKKAIVRMLRAFKADARGDEVSLISGSYQIIPGDYDNKTGQIENWRFDAHSHETFQQEHDRAFVDNELLMGEIELGHAIVLDVLDRKDSTHPIFQAENIGKGKQEESAPSAEAAKGKKGIFSKLFGRGE